MAFLTFTDLRISLLVPANIGLGAAAQGDTAASIAQASAYFAISDIQVTARFDFI